MKNKIFPKVNNKNQMSKNWNTANFVKKILKLVMLKCWNHSTTTRNYAVT